MSILCSITYYFLTGLHDVPDTYVYGQILYESGIFSGPPKLGISYRVGLYGCKLRNCLFKIQGQIWLQLQNSGVFWTVINFSNCQSLTHVKPIINRLLRLSLPQLVRKGLHRNMCRPNAGSRNMPGNKCLPALVAAPRAFACVQLPSHVSRMLICSYGFIWHVGNAEDTSLSMSRVPSWNVFLSVIFSFLPLYLGQDFSGAQAHWSTITLCTVCCPVGLLYSTKLQL